MVLAICLIVVGAVLSAVGILRLRSSRRQVLSPGEIPRGGGIVLMVAGDVALVAGVLMLVL